MFLTAEQLIELTGYKRSSLQVNWLRRQGIRHHVRKDGRPVVLSSDLSGHEPPRVRPNFSNLAPVR